MFEKLPQEKIKFIADKMPLIPVKKGNLILFSQEEPMIYFLKKGTVKIGTYTESGKEDLKYLVQQGYIFGELALVDRENPNDFAVALENCLLCRVEVSSMRWMMEQFPHLKDAIMQLLGNRIHKLEKRLESVLFKTAKARICEFLLEYLTQFGKQVNGYWQVKNQLTHTDIARLTSTSRQTVNTFLNQLRKENVLVYDTQHIRIEVDNIPLLRSRADEV